MGKFVKFEYKNRLNLQYQKHKKMNKVCQYPLSDAQTAIYTYCMANPDYNVYQICIHLGPYTDIDAQQLKFAVEKAINNHPILKISIATSSNGTPLMLRNDSLPPMVDIVENTNEFKNTISLSGRLYHIAVVDNCQGCGLIICVHHLIFDGYSMNIFLKDISSAYFGEELLTEDYNFFDVTTKETSIKNTKEYDCAKKYFLNTFRSTPILTHPPYYLQSQQYQPCNISRQLSIKISQWQQICQQLCFSANIISTTVFAIVLGCFCGEEAARFSTIFHGRHGKQMKHVVGMLAKTIPVSAEWSAKQNIQSLMQQIRRQLSHSMIHDICPFSEIKSNCDGIEDISFVYQGNTQHLENFCGKEIVYNFFYPAYTGSSLSIELWLGNEYLMLKSEFDRAKYSSQYVENMMETFENILLSLQNASTIDEIKLLSPKMSAQIDSFGINASTPANTNIMEMFAEIVANNPTATAIKYLDKKITYNELDSITNRLANYLKNLGAMEGKNVAILIERSEMMVILPLAVLKTGAAYIPLQHEFHPEKIKKILFDSKADILLTDSRIQNYSRHIVDTNELYNIVNNYPDTSLSNVNKNIFGIFYTSGSTGEPKGVIITHRNVLAYCKWYHKFFSPNTNIVIAAYNNFAFDASITDIFPALTSGATIAIVPQNVKTELTALADFCDVNTVNIIDLPTQIGRLFAANKRCKWLKHIVLGGETVSQFTNCNHYRIYNQYGPTETTVAVTIYEIDGSEKNIPIGKPLDCVKIYVVDNYGRRVPIGAIGEIWIAGPQVSNGYLNNNANNNKFVANIFDNNPDFNIVFRTGDYGRWNNDGNLEFVGRRDNLVKIRGYRIDIGELEFALKTCRGVLDAAATTYKDSANMMQISAYVVGNQPLNLSKIRNEIRNKIQILPQYLQQIDSIPTTLNGKIDRTRLPLPKIEVVSKKIKKPQTKLESIICETFENILNIKTISTDDNFFEIGGTSISAMQVVVALENKGFNIKYGNIFENPTAETLAKYLSCNPTIVGVASQNSTHFDKKVSISHTLKYCEVDNIVLTGATGFFGAHLLLELLENNHSNIICVIRYKDGKSAKQRLEYISKFYFNTSLLSKFPHRIQIIEGDLTDTKTIKILESKSLHNVAIVNSAAIVKYFAEPQKIKSVNVDVVEKLIGICIEKKWKYVHISTLSAAIASGSIVDEYTACPLLPNALPYEVSKWQAEQIAINAANKGLKLVLIRLGNLAARSYDGVFQINNNENAASKLIEVVRKLKCYPLKIDNLHFDITPVDYAAHSVSKLISVEQYPAIFHVFNPHKATISQIVDAQMVSNEEFATLTKYLPSELRILIEYLLDATPCTWSNEYTLNVLQNIN